MITTRYPVGLAKERWAHYLYPIPVRALTILNLRSLIQLHLERLKVCWLVTLYVLLQKNWREFFVLGAREMPTVVQGELNLKHLGSYAAASQKYTFVVFSFLRFLLQAMPSSSRQR